MQRSTIHAFFETAARKGDAVAYRQKIDGAWVETSWSTYRDQVRQVARALVALGVQPGGAVAIMGPNRPEWVIAALAAMAVGAAPAGVYPTSTAEQTGYVIGHAEARVAVVHDAAQLAKLSSERGSMPRLEHVVLMVGEAPGALSWAELLARAEGVADAEVDARLDALRPEDVGTLIYTSGTTGNPKAVRLTHENLAFTSETYRDAIGFAETGEHLVSYLPLSHIAEQDLTLHGQAFNGFTVHFCEQLEALGDALRECRPTVFFAVPRVWEKIEAKMKEAGATAPWLRRKIAAWARGVGFRAGTARMEGRPLPRLYPLAHKLVFTKVRERLGLDRCRFCVSGAAKISRDTLEFFLSLDVPIYEVYGMSENTALTTLNLPGAHRLGTVGRALPGVEMRIAEDGEILVRGRHVFAGYAKDEAATREALDEEGWLHTGDVGELDADGFLRITDRKKDLFKTSGGKYIAPSHLESLLKGIPGVGQPVVIGEGRNYCVALVALDPDSTPKLLADLGASGTSDPKVRAWLEGEIARVNAGLAKYETIKKFALLPEPFSVETGELTPTLKLRRKVVTQKFASEIESLYR